MEKSIGFIGAGRITNIFLHAFKNKNISLRNVKVFDINPATSEALQKKFQDIQIAELSQVAGQDIVFIALHPPVIGETLEKVKAEVKKDAAVISLAPKISISKISAVLDNTNIARLIPNATSVINEGYNPVCFHPKFKGKPEIMNLLSILGKTFETEETKMEGYAITSAMLPTYFWYQWYEMLAVAQQIGLTENESRETIEQTLLAAIHTAFSPELTSGEVLDLIPVKPMGEYEEEMKLRYQQKLNDLYQKIKSA
jgi:pyrroline-5-carboxylate reductase